MECEGQRDGLTTDEEDDNLDEEDDLPFVPVPPDGGWGWVVCFCSFLSNLILDGIAYMFGVLLTPLCKDFGAEPGSVAWVGSLLAGCYMLSGPVVGGLVNKYGCRPVCISGSILTFFAFTAATFSVNVPMMMVLYGVVGGFGLGLIYLPATVAVGYYFESKRALATGIAVCGSGVGTFAMAPLASYLEDLYGWRGTILIFAAISLNCCINGALMRPLETVIVIEDVDEEVLDDEANGHFEVKFPDGTSHRESLTISKDNLEPGVQSNLQIHRRASRAQPPNLGPINEMSAILESPKNGSSKIHPQAESLMKTVLRTRTASGDPPSFQISPAASRERAMSLIPLNPTISPVEARSRTISENQNVKVLAPVKEGITIPRRGSQANVSIMLRVSSSGLFEDSSSNIHIPSGSTLRVPGSFRIGSGNISPDIGGSAFQFPIPSSPLSRKRCITVNQNPLARKDIFYSRSVVDFNQLDPQIQDQESVAHPVGLTSNVQSYVSFVGLRSNPTSYLSMPRESLVNSALAIPTSWRDKRVSSGMDEDECIVDIAEGGGILVAMQEMMKLSLLKDPVFLLLCISNVFGFMGFYTPFVFLPNMAAQYEGISTKDAAFLLSIIGISNTVGRVISGWISDFSWANTLVINNFSLILSAGCVFIFPSCTTYFSFSIVGLLFGMTIAAYISLTSIIIVDIVGLDNLTSGFGLIAMFRGLAAIVGPPFAGFVYEATESYNMSFYLSACLLLASGITSIILDILRRRTRKIK